jgi:cAMP-dependent protein kinase regulator
MSLPKEYVDELNILNREIADKQPANVIEFCANYFNGRLKQQQEHSQAEVGSEGQQPLFAGFNTHSFSNDPTHANVHEHLEESDTMGQGFTPRRHPVNFNVNRRTSVSAERITPDSFSGASSVPRQQNKSLNADQLARLNDAVNKNFLFSNLDEDARHSVLHSLEEKRVKASTVIIQEGDEGDFYYIVESGTVDYYKGQEKFGSSGPGSSFGELALMYNSPRAATVKAATDAVLWALDRITFKKILLDKTTQKRSMYGEFLKQVPVLNVLNSYELSKIADALQPKVYEPGQVVIQEGEVGEDFYLIESGSAVVTKVGQGKVQELARGDYFGEVALLNDLPRQATVTASTKMKVATLNKSGFQRLLGPVVDILKRQDPTHHSS